MYKEPRIDIPFNEVEALLNLKQKALATSDLRVTPHVIAYMDFLGITNKIDSQESSNFLQEINYIYNLTVGRYDITKDYFDKILFSKMPKRENDKVKFSDIANPTIKYKIFSDNVIIAIEIPQEEPHMINFYSRYLLEKIISLSGKFQATAMFNGLLLRGGVTIGDLYIDNNFVYGEGLVKAYNLECKIANHPRIVVDKAFQDITLKDDKCWSDIDGEIYINYYNDIGLSTYITEDMAKYLCDTLQELHKNTLDKKSKDKLRWTINYHNNYFQRYSKIDGYLNEYLIDIE